jgi:N-terminal domain of anti-restriction factor ArdC
VTEEIETRQTEEESRQVTGNTGGASRNDGTERKAMVSWAALLDEAVKKPGFIHEAYSRFHNYSLGNQLLALFQCFERSIQPGPLATWPKWKELGRNVKKGEKALTLCMPVNCKRTRTVTKEDGTEQDEEFAYTHFTYKPH